MIIKIINEHDNFKIGENGGVFSKREENTVEKEEILP